MSEAALMWTFMIGIPIGCPAAVLLAMLAADAVRARRRAAVDPAPPAEWIDVSEAVAGCGDLEFGDGTSH